MLKSLNVLGHDYAYLDSGAPPSTNYTTWAILHGMGFNGAVFEKLMPRAHAHNLRIVSIYRRGYPPSSSFDAHELDGIGFGKKLEEAEPFFRAQCAEIATFLVRFATEQGIPLADKHSRTGGIALIGWSLASIHALALLAYAHALPGHVRSTLETYLHTILSHDAGQYTFGMPNPVKHDISLWMEPDDRKRFDAFYYWVSAHYIHKSVTSENMDDLDFNDPSPDIPHSMQELSKAQRAEYTCLEAFTSCDRKLLFCDATAFAALTKYALFDKARAEALSDVRVRFMSGGTTPGVLVCAVWMLRKHAENPGAFFGPGAEKARDIKYINQVEGNHVVFWEDPEKAIQQYSTSINL